MNKLQLFAFDNNNYCDFSSSAAKAVAGKDILLAIWSADGTKLLAISGQQGLTINRSADSIEITSKDTQGGWKSKIAGMKEWSIDNDGLYVPNDESHSILSQAFDNSDPVCIKVINGKTKEGMFGGRLSLRSSLRRRYDLLPDLGGYGRSGGPAGAAGGPRYYARRHCSLGRADRGICSGYC